MLRLTGSSDLWFYARLRGRKREKSSARKQNRLDRGSKHWLTVIESGMGVAQEAKGSKNRGERDRPNRERRRLTRRGCWSQDRTASTGRWEMDGEVRRRSDREEGDRRRQRRRRQGEVDSDELPTLIIWENAARGAGVTCVTGHNVHGTRGLDPFLIHI